MEHLIIKLLTKRILLNFPLRLPELKSDFTLTLGYLNPALNNPALFSTVQNLPAGGTLLYVKVVFFAAPLGFGLLLLGLLLLGLLSLGFGFLREIFQSEIRIINRS